DFRINRIAQCCDQSANTAFHFVDDQFLRRRLWSFEHFEIVTAGTKKVLRRIANARCGKHPEMLFLSHSWNLIMKPGMQERKQELKEPKGTAAAQFEIRVP